MTGGGALIRGLDLLLSQETSLPFTSTRIRSPASFEAPAGFWTTKRNTGPYEQLREPWQPRHV
jgi:hypothetical protein